MKMKVEEDVSESYPPLFRPPKNPTHDPKDSPSNDEEEEEEEEEEPIKLNPDDYSDPIPIIDLQSTNLDNQIDEACKNWGIFRLVNHGIPTTLLNQLQEHSRKILSLPFETKQALFNSSRVVLNYFWGTPALTPSGSALSVGPQHVNWVEGINVPLCQISQIEEDLNPILDAFRLLLEEYGRHLARLASTIYEVAAKNLKLDSKKYSKSYLSEPTGIVRIYRYLSCSNYNHIWGMGAHTDSSVLSILNQDEVGGLEVLKDDKWSDIKPISNTLIINLGDMMQAMSNDEYKSVTHRVKVNKREERISICYFVFPTDDGIIESSKYKPFSYGDFRAQVQEDVKTHGFKVGLDRFKLT